MMKDFKFISQRTSPEWATAFDEMPYSLEEKARMNQYIEARRDAIYKDFDAVGEVAQIVKTQRVTAQRSIFWHRLYPYIEKATFRLDKMHSKPQRFTDMNCVEAAGLYAATDSPMQTVEHAIRIYAEDNELAQSDVWKLQAKCYEFALAHLQIACHAKGIIKLMRPVTVAQMIGNKKYVEVVRTPNHDARQSGHKTVAEAIITFLLIHAPTLLTEYDNLTVEKGLIDLLDENAWARIWLGLHFHDDNTESVSMVKHFTPIVTEYMSWNW